MAKISEHYTLRDDKVFLLVRRYKHGKATRKHTHDFIELVFVDQGFSMHRVEGSTSLLIPGDMFFVVPGAAHEYWNSVNNRVYNCMFYSDVLGENLGPLTGFPLLDKILVPDAGTKWGKIRLKHEEGYEILGLLKKLESETCNRPPGWMIRAKALLVDLLVCLSRAWYGTEAAGEKNDDGVSNVASRVLDVLEMSLSNKMSVADIAKKAGYNPEYFSRTFKKLTGISPSSYLASVRISMAAQKLADPGVAISDVAAECGFDDANYFSRLFKKETGKTPSEFRNMIISERYCK